MKTVIRFLRGVVVELKRVRWSRRDELVKYIVATLSFMIFFGGFFYLVNFLWAVFTGLLI